MADTLDDEWWLEENDSENEIGEWSIWNITLL